MFRESTVSQPEITELLDAWSAGERQALNRLMPLVMGDLRALARAYMARESPGHTLDPTGLVPEAYLKLAGRRDAGLHNRVQFFSVLASTMRRILVDHARRKQAARHGGGTPAVQLEEVRDLPSAGVDLVALDDALKDLAAFAPRQAEALQLSYFGGLNHGEIAVALAISPTTVKRDLKAARMWLLRRLGPGTCEAAAGEVAGIPP